MASYERIMDAAQDRKKRAETNQLGMFDLLGEDMACTEDIKDVPEYPMNQLLALEKDVAVLNNREKVSENRLADLEHEHEKA